MSSQTRKFKSTVLAFSSLLIALFPPSSIAADLPVERTISTCHNITTGKDSLKRTSSCTPSSSTVAHWVLQPTVTSDTPWPEGSFKTLTACSNRPDSTRTFLVIRKRCLSSEVSHTYIRYISQPVQPELLAVTARSSQSVTLQIKVERENIYAPIAKYAVRINGGEVRKVSPTPSGEIVISGLKAATEYQFEIASISADGISAFSQVSEAIATPIEIIEKVSQSSTSSGSTPAPQPVVTPVFTLPATSLTLTYPFTNSFLPTATGGAIDSFSVTTLPLGLRFDSATGGISGHPMVDAVNQSVTITAFNSHGQYAQTFSLTTVSHTYSTGDVGPGGGRVFYVHSDGFSCGATSSQTCHYLEYAPHYWNGGDIEPVLSWASSSPTQILSTNYFAKGQGQLGTLEIASQSTDRNNAAAKSLDYRGGGYDDWYLPNLGEMVQITYFIERSDYPGGFGIYADVRNILFSYANGGRENLGEFTPANYWTSNDYAILSSDSDGNRGPTYFSFHDGSTHYSSENPLEIIYTRPIRAF